MKVNHEYLKGLMESFEKSETTFFTVRDGMAHGYNPNMDEFLFHMLLLKDSGFIEAYGDKDDIGYKLNGTGSAIWSIKKLRLTAMGHEYISNLNEPSVWEGIQKDFKDSSVQTVKKVASDVVSSIVKKKVEGWLS